MLEKYVKLNSIDDVKSFVEITSSKDYDITLVADNTVVNAKSILGILDLDLTKPIKLRADCKAQGELMHQLKPFLWQLLGNLKG